MLEVGRIYKCLKLEIRVAPGRLGRPPSSEAPRHPQSKFQCIVQYSVYGRWILGQCVDKELGHPQFKALYARYRRGSWGGGAGAVVIEAAGAQY